MRLWNRHVIPTLPRQLLLALHRDACALRTNWGTAWGVVGECHYIYNYGVAELYTYHHAVLDEMSARGYKPDPRWLDPTHRGKREPLPMWAVVGLPAHYPEHTEEGAKAETREVFEWVRARPDVCSAEDAERALTGVKRFSRFKLKAVTPTR